ncbi:MAG: NfeD family protein [Pyrinomonadaceae bacterium]
MNSLVAVVLFTIVIIALAGIVLTSRHKKMATDGVPFVGASAVVNSKLNPEGTVLFRGEVWRARSRNKNEIDVQAVVKIIGVHDHLLLVDLL